MSVQFFLSNSFDFSVENDFQRERDTLNLCVLGFFFSRCVTIFMSINPKPLKVGNRPDLLLCRRRATYRWKALDKGYNFASNLITIRGLHKKLCALKVARVLVVAISGLPLGSPGTNKPFGCDPREEAHSILYKGWWCLPPSPGCGESSESRVAYALS
jgi:hypothetical protein